MAQVVTHLLGSWDVVKRAVRKVRSHKAAAFLNLSIPLPLPRLSRRLQLLCNGHEMEKQQLLPRGVQKTTCRLSFLSAICLASLWFISILARGVQWQLHTSTERASESLKPHVFQGDLAYQLLNRSVESSR